MGRTSRLAFAFILLASSAVAAPPPKQSSLESAAFKRGLEQFSKEDYDGAIKTWETLVAAMGEHDAYKVLFNLGQTYEKKGDKSKALERYSAFVTQAEAQADPAVRSQLDTARARVQELKPPPPPPPVEPQPPPPPPPREHHDEPPPAPSRTWLYIGAGATAVSFALPISFFIVASGKADDANQLGAGHTGYTSEYDSFGSFQTAYAISYALPLLVAGATVAYYFLHK